jgi:hypothetical protein
MLLFFYSNAEGIIIDVNHCLLGRSNTEIPYQSRSVRKDRLSHVERSELLFCLFDDDARCWFFTGAPSHVVVFYFTSTYIGEVALLVS